MQVRLWRAELIGPAPNPQAVTIFDRMGLGPEEVKKLALVLAEAREEEDKAKKQVRCCRPWPVVCCLDSSITYLFPEGCHSLSWVAAAVHHAADPL